MLRMLQGQAREELQKKITQETFAGWHLQRKLFCLFNQVFVDFRKAEKRRKLSFTICQNEGARHLDTNEILSSWVEGEDVLSGEGCFMRGFGAHARREDPLCW